MGKASKAKAPAKTGAKTDFREVNPNAAKTLLAVREMGYDSFASIMDLVDNAIDAGAENIAVTIQGEGSGLTIDILDDGKGMDEATLHESLRLGSNTEHDAKKHLGKFGMGLVTASLSMARHVWVLTRQGLDKPAFEATFDMGVIERENAFVIKLQPAEGKAVLSHLDQPHGTLVRLSQIDRINDTNVPRFAANLRTRMGQVYRHFLSKGVTMTVNKRHVQRYDPLMLEHPAVTLVLEQNMDLGDGTRAKLVVVELPDLGQAGDAENNIFPENSGFYVVRNGREIISAETFGFYKKHHAYSHFRAELSYHGNSTVFHEDIKKTSIHPDDKLREKLQKLTEKLIAKSGQRARESGTVAPVRLTHNTVEKLINTKLAVEAGKTELVKQMTAKPSGKRGRPSKAEAEKRQEQEDKLKAEANTAPRVEFTEADTGDTGRFFSADRPDKNKLVITYNAKHPFVQMVAASKGSALLDTVAFALARAEEEHPEGKKLLNRACDYLKMLAVPHTEAKTNEKAKQPQAA